MKDDITPQGALFNDLINLPVHVRFDQPEQQLGRWRIVTQSAGQESWFDSAA